MLLLNVAQKSFFQLLGPLEYAQEAPVPLLWFYRLVYLLGGGGELPMRALSLVCSGLALFLFYRLAQRVLPDRRAVLFSIWLLALSPGAILFAAQAKPYSLDLLVAAGLLYLATPWFLNPGGPHYLSWLALAAGLAPWFSLPAIFVTGGIVAGLLLRTRQGGARPALVLLAVVAGSFVLEFGLVLKRCLIMQEFIKNWFLEFTLSSWKWSFCQIFFGYLGPQSNDISLPVLVLAGLAVGGLVVAGREYGWAWAVALILPLGLALAASMAHIYPIFGRLLLFEIPGLYLLIGYGVAQLFRIIPRPRLLALLLIILIIPCLRASFVAYGRPEGGVKEALQFIEAHRQPQDLVLYDSLAFPTCSYYRLLGRPYAVNPKCPLKLADWCWGKVNPWELDLDQLLPLIPRGRRIWLVAESLDYARARVTEVLPYWQRLTEHMRTEREPLACYITDRVQVWGFLPRTGPHLSLSK